MSSKCVLRSGRGGQKGVHNGPGLSVALRDGAALVGEGSEAPAEKQTLWDAKMSRNEPEGCLPGASPELGTHFQGQSVYVRTGPAGVCPTRRKGASDPGVTREAVLAHPEQRGQGLDGGTDLLPERQ